jgi:hypothetical protein
LTPGDFIYAISMALKSLEKEGKSTKEYAIFAASIVPKITSGWGSL